MRLGIIGARGGSALAAAVECLHQAGKTTDLFIVVDRACGVLQWANDQKFPAREILYKDCSTFSSNALKYFRDNGVEQVLLSYTRRVGEPLIGGLPVLNIHPSLLPSFRGLNGVADALKAGVRILGASLHGVDAGLDTGPIVAQVATGLPIGATAEMANKISFLQKTYLILVWYELVHDFKLSVDINSRSVHFDRTPPTGIAMSPAIETTALLDAFNLLQEKENCYVIHAC